MASTFETFYDLNPITVIDQNQWEVRHAEVAAQFRTQPVMYTPLIEWSNEVQQTGARTTYVTELLDGDVDFDELPFTANYIDATAIDSRMRKFTISRYGDKVQLHKSSNIFQQWKVSGGRDWRPLLRGTLGRNIIRKFEILARNSFLRGPQNFWTYAGGATDWGTIAADDTFDVGVVKQWNLRLGNTGTPVVPGDRASAKVAIIPPGVTYDFFAGLATAATNEAQMWRDAQLYAGKELNYELGTFNKVRFVETPNDNYGENMSVLYNCGAITKQYGVAVPISAGDGAPDPETTAVDDVWYIGQKGVTHNITLESAAAASDFAQGDIVTIHTARTSAYGVTNGVDPLSGKTVQRRVVSYDHAANTLTFDRPIMFNYKTPFVATSVSGAEGTYYAFVTKARHIAMVLVMGARGGVLGGVGKPIEFYEPKPIDDFESVWRYTWDAHVGYNIWDPNLFEVHFCALTLPKAGGLITP